MVDLHRPRPNCRHRQLWGKKRYSFSLILLHFFLFAIVSLPYPSYNFIIIYTWKYQINNTKHTVIFTFHIFFACKVCGELLQIPVITQLKRSELTLKWIQYFRVNQICRQGKELKNINIGIESFMFERYSLITARVCANKFS